MSRVYSSSAVLPWVMLQVLKEDPRGATKLAFRRRERKVRSERRVYHKKGRGRRSYHPHIQFFWLMSHFTHQS